MKYYLSLFNLVDDFCTYFAFCLFGPGDAHRLDFRTGALLKVSVEGNILLVGDFGVRFQTEIVTGCREAPSVLD